MSGTPQLFKADSKTILCTNQDLLILKNDYGTIISVSWRSGIDRNRLGGASQNLRPVRGSRYCLDAISLRDYVKEYAVKILKAHVMELVKLVTPH